MKHKCNLPKSCGLRNYYRGNVLLSDWQNDLVDISPICYCSKLHFQSPRRWKYDGMICTSVYFRADVDSVERRFDDLCARNHGAGIDKRYCYEMGWAYVSIHSQTIYVYKD